MHGGTFPWDSCPLQTVEVGTTPVSEPLKAQEAETLVPMEDLHCQGGHWSRVLGCRREEPPEITRQYHMVPDAVVTGRTAAKNQMDIPYFC